MWDHHFSILINLGNITFTPRLNHRNINIIYNAIDPNYNSGVQRFSHLEISSYTNIKILIPMGEFFMTNFDIDHWYIHSPIYHTNIGCTCHKLLVWFFSEYNEWPHIDHGTYGLVKFTCVQCPWIIFSIIDWGPNVFKFKQWHGVKTPPSTTIGCQLTKFIVKGSYLGTIVIVTNEACHLECIKPSICTRLEG